jgi:hypothetical protein
VSSRATSARTIDGAKRDQHREPRPPGHVDGAGAVDTIREHSGRSED